MKTRILSAFAALILLFAVMLCSNLWVLKIAVGLISAIGLYELYRAFEYEKFRILTVTGLCIGFVIPVMASWSVTVVLLFVYALTGAVVMLVRWKDVSVSDWINLWFFQLYVPCSFTSLILVREMELGGYAVWFILGGAWLTDTFAYFSGRAFGKKKLCPHISPNKTVAGALGGVFGTTASAAVYGWFLRRFCTVHFVPVILLGVCLGIVSQIGDLTASKIKRERNIKDFGNLMPGHGGVMDRFDSILLTAPVVLLFLRYLTVFVK